MGLSVNIVKRGHQSVTLGGSYISGDSSDTKRKRIKLVIAGRTIDIEASGGSGSFSFNDNIITGLSAGTTYSWSCTLFEYRSSYWYQLSEHSASGTVTTYAIGQPSFSVSIATSPSSGQTTANLAGSFFSGYDDLDADAYYSYPRRLYVTFNNGSTITIESNEKSGHHNNFTHTFTGLTPGTTYKWNCTLYYQATGGFAPSNYTTSGEFKTDDPSYYAYLTFDLNGGNGSFPQQKGSGTEFGAKYLFKMPAVTPTHPSGYTFKHWEITGSGVSSVRYANVGATIELECYITVSPGTHYTATAIWEVTFYGKLSFSANGGSGAPSPLTGSAVSTSSSASYTFTIPTTIPTRSGYKFLYWQVTVGSATYNKSPSTAGQPVTLSVPLYSTDSSNRTTYTMYAVWEKIKGAVWVYYGGNWVQAIPYIYYNGAWRCAAPYVYYNGWKPTS